MIVFQFGIKRVIYLVMTTKPFPINTKPGFNSLRQITTFITYTIPFAEKDGSFWQAVVSPDCDHKKLEAALNTKCIAINNPFDYFNIYFSDASDNFGRFNILQTIFLHDHDTDPGTHS
ncbi:hypothetical protein Q0A17_00575 [Citrobacter sp. S2-9]|uniref:Uncharacterized protein n=1 Tax=Citrobacter enshiensis TaxID=2971264 RepID=A0ABT8PQW3_9ENTR|nr:hypothetical protein [Citrobacter enshiensis]MDN8597919.1 hypothetical protein [Citrobacter enshiensis]